MTRFLLTRFVLAVITLFVLSILVFVTGGIVRAAGVEASWIVIMSGVGLMLLWLLIAGVWLMFNPVPRTAPIGAMAPASSG